MTNVVCCSVCETLCGDVRYVTRLVDDGRERAREHACSTNCAERWERKNWSAADEVHCSLEIVK